MDTEERLQCHRCVTLLSGVTFRPTTGERSPVYSRPESTVAIVPMSPRARHSIRRPDNHTFCHPDDQTFTPEPAPRFGSEFGERKCVSNYARSRWSRERNTREEPTPRGVPSGNSAESGCSNRRLNDKTPEKTDPPSNYAQIREPGFAWFPA